MLAVALVTGDEFLVGYNVSIDTSDIMASMNRLNFVWDQVKYRYAFFVDRYTIDFVAIAGASGICYNFNMVDAADLYHLEL
jgi:hypothetical protein